LASAQGQASQVQLPGQSLIEQQIGGATSKGMTAAKEATDSPAAILGQLAQLTGNEQDKYTDLGIAAAQNWTSNQDVLRNALSTMAGEEKAQWQWDKANPYLAAMQTAAGLQKTGTENLIGGVTDIGNVAMQTDMNKQIMDLWKGIYGQDKDKPKPDTTTNTDTNKRIGSYTQNIPTFDYSSPNNIKYPTAPPVLPNPTGDNYTNMISEIMKGIKFNSPSFGGVPEMENLSILQNNSNPEDFVTMMQLLNSAKKKQNPSLLTSPTMNMYGTSQGWGGYK
jgi:hypothetical protein